MLPPRNGPRRTDRPESFMRTRRSKSASPRLPRDAERLVALARSLGASGSRAEDDYWEALLRPEVTRLLDAGADASIDAALDTLYPTPQPYDALIDMVETVAETAEIEHDGKTWRGLLVAAPVLAWSRYAIASGPLRNETVDALQVQLRAHLAADDVQVAVAPTLYSIDQLPRGFAALRTLTRKLTRDAVMGMRSASAGKLAETVPILADTRYVLAVLAAPRGVPLWRWQDPTGRAVALREEALAAWRAQAQPSVANALSGCVLELLLPDGFHVSCREADRLIRPWSIPAALALLEGAVGIEPAQLRAVVAPFGAEGIEEYRIGFGRKSNNDLFHGIVWPLYGSEQGPEPEGPLDQIEAELRQAGVTEITVLDELFPPEFCDDCGAPLYADPTGDLVHAELPEDAETPRTHLH